MRNSYALIGAISLFVGASKASTITINSSAGLATSMAGVSSVAITPHPFWQSNNPLNPGDPGDVSAIWISFADTGYGGSHFQPYQGTTPAVSIYKTFESAAGTLILNVWADDTADVKLDGNYLAHSVFTQSICSGQAIGCLPEDVAQLIVPLTAGDHTLEFVLYQVGTGTNTTSNPFGLLFTGTATAPTPEPAAFGLLGGGLLAFFSIRRYVT